MSADSSRHEGLDTPQFQKFTIAVLDIVQLSTHCIRRASAPLVALTSAGAREGRTSPMPKRTTIETEQQPAGKEIRIPADNVIKTFSSTFDDVKSTVDEANEELKEAADEAAKKHLVLSPFKAAKKLHDDFKAAKNQAIAGEKLARYLAHFDHYRKFFKLDELANLQGRLFGVGEIGAKPPRETDEDGEPDMRPDHLRQPGASAANVVQDLAAKTGAKTSTDPIEQIGRGPKLN